MAGWRALLFAIALEVGLPAPTGAQTVRDDVPCFNGAAAALAASGGVLHIGGSFTRAGDAAGSVSRLDPSGAELPFPKVSGEVHVIVADGSGGWFLGGRIVAVGDVPRFGLAHIRSDFTLDGWHADVEGVVDALALDGTKLIVGGTFTKIGGVSRRSLAVVDATSGTVQPWDPSLAGVSGADPSVTSIAVGNAAWFVAGAFDHTLGAARAGLASYQRSNGALTSWDPAPDGAVDRVLVQGDTVFVCGQFSQISGQARDKLAGLDANSAAATSLSLTFGISFLIHPPVRVTNMVLAGRTLYLRGAFDSIDGYGFNAAAAVDAYNGGLRPWAAGFPSAFTLVGARLLLGYLTFTGRGGAVAWIDTTADATRLGFGPEYNESVLALAGDASTVLVGGRFSGTNWPDRNRLAAVDVVSGALGAWTADADNNIIAMAAGGGRVYFSGIFGNVNGQPHYLVAAVDEATGALTSFDPQNDNYVMSMASDGTTIFMGGTFSQMAGQPRQRLAAFDAATGALLPWTASADNEVDALAIHGSTLYVGGYFAQLDGEACPGIGALDLATGARRPWTPGIAIDLVGPAPNVRAIAAADGHVFAGGMFDTIGGARRRNVAALDSVSASALTWGSAGANGPVFAIGLDSAAVYVGGEFDSVGTQSRSGLAAFDRATGACLGWDPHPDRRVLAIQPVDTTIWVGGDFAIIGGTLHSGLAGLARATPGGSSPTPPPVSSAVWLSKARPLPAAQLVTWDYSLPTAMHVKAEVHDILGRRIVTLLNGTDVAGAHTLRWDGIGSHGKVESGIYVLTLTTPSGRVSSQIVLIR